MGRIEKAHTGKVCVICGDKGFYEELVTCSQCKMASEHSYCTVNYPTPVSKAWICQECEEENKQAMQLPSRRISFIKTKESAIVKCISADQVASSASRSRTPTATPRPIKSLSKNFMTMSEDVSDTPQSVLIKPELASSGSPSDLQFSSLNMNDEQLAASEKALGLCPDIPFKESDIQGTGLSPTLLMFPNENEIQWRGRFVVKDMGYGIYEDIQAHFPGKISVKTYNASKMMPENLQFSLMNRLDMWPQIFKLDPPSSDDVAIYFLPSEFERPKRKYIHLLEQMNKHDLAMHCRLDDLELLIYTSKLLLLDTQKLNTNLYLWGIYRHPIRKKLKQGAS